MAVKTRAQLLAENSADFPNNTTGEISPTDLRGQMDDTVDSALLREDIPGLNVSAAHVTSTGATTKTLAAWTQDITTGGGTGFAPLNSPVFTGTPTAPTASLGNNTTQLATTAFVLANATGGGGGFAPLNSPAFTGVPTAPTAAIGNNTTQIATTAWVLANAPAGEEGAGILYPSKAAATAVSHPSTVKTIRTACYATHGYGGAIYNRLPSSPNLMLQVGPHGVTSFGCFRSMDRFTSAGTTDAIHGGWWMLDLAQHITPLMFGAIGNSPVLPADDGPGIREAHHFCQWARLGIDTTAPLAGKDYSPYCQYIPLFFPMGRYNINSGVSFQMVDHMKWIGEAEYGDETNFVPMLRYNVSDFFTLTPPGPGSILDPNAPTDRVDWVTIKGLCFDGRNQRRCFIKPTSITDSSQIKLFHSTFESCGFKNWNHAFCNLLSGVMIRYCFFQNNLCGLKCAGADNIIEDNYMSGSNWKPVGDPEVPAGNSNGFPGVTDPAGAPGNSDILPANQSTFAVVLGSFRLSRFNRNYITGMPQMCMKCSHSLDGTIFEQNWFDYADWSLLFIENSRGGSFVNNTFNNGMLGIDPTVFASPPGKSRTNTTSATYNALIRIANNSHHLNFSNNTFGYYEALTSRDQLPTAPGDPLDYTHSPTTLVITGGSNISDPLNVVQGRSNNIKWENNNYTSDYKFSMSYDAASGAPIILERGGTGDASRFPYSRYGTYAFSDFHGTISPTGNGIFLPEVGGTATGVVAAVATAGTSNTGLQRFSFGAGANAYASMRTSTAMMRFGGGEARCYIVFIQQTAPTVGEPFTVRAGFHNGNATTPTPTNGVFFEFKETDSFWRCIVRRASVDTTYVTTIPWTPLTQAKFKIVVSDVVDYTLTPPVGWAEFYSVSGGIDTKVGGVKAITSWLPATEYTDYPAVTNIPHGAGQEVGCSVTAIKTGGSAAVATILDLDLIEFEQRFSSQR